VPDRSAKDALTNPSVQTDNESALLVALGCRLDSLPLSTDPASLLFPHPTATQPEPGPAAGLSGAFSTQAKTKHVLANHEVHQLWEGRVNLIGFARIDRI
jgi:hypothetical protein